MIYKIFRAAEMAEFASAGRTLGAPIDLADGYVHFSAAAQVAETAARHFAGEDGLWLLACDEAAMGDAIRWEPSRGGQLFPHLYRALERADVTWAIPFGPKDHAVPDFRA